MSLRINIDSDSVVYDLSTILVNRARVQFGDHCMTPRSWDPSHEWGVEPEDVANFFERESKKGLYAFGAPVPGAVDAIVKLASQGHDLRIVTHKHGMGRQRHIAMQDTIQWYMAHGLLELVDIVFARGDKTQYPADVVIDDKPTLEWAQFGKTNLLFDQPWNQGIIRLGNPVWVKRVKGWAEVVDEIEFDAALETK